MPIDQDPAEWALIILNEWRVEGERLVTARLQQEQGSDYQDSNKEIPDL